MLDYYSAAYIVAVDMGYGHQRAAFPLIDIAAVPDEWNLEKPIIISANAYYGIPYSDHFTWEQTRKSYEIVSRLSSVPILGKYIFGVMDYFQRIEPFYPKRDLSRPGIQTRLLYKTIAKGFGKHLIETLNKKPLPLVTTFFITAFFAEEHGYKGPIYCLCTDTDISRAWAPLHPKQSRIIYLAPNKRVKDRLMLYGVLERNIVVTGFPLPKIALGSREKLEALRGSLGCRIAKLDPRGVYQKKYQKVISGYLGAQYCDINSKGLLNITFAVGGAAAQANIGTQILFSLAPHIKKGELEFNLVAGSSQFVNDLYHNEIKLLGLEKYLDNGIRIIYHKNKFEYFKIFNELLTHTDILWTKPSELSFYAGLGLPIIMAPPIGSQEEYNRSWLHSVGAGFEQEDPRYTSQWLFDWINSGWLAEAAMGGFLDAPKKATYHIEDLILRGRKVEIEDIHLL